MNRTTIQPTISDGKRLCRIFAAAIVPCAAMSFCIVLDNSANLPSISIWPAIATALTAGGFFCWHATRDLPRIVRIVITSLYPLAMYFALIWYSLFFVCAVYGGCL